MLFSGAKTGDAKNAAILPFERNKSQRRIIREIATNAIETYESINIFDERFFFAIFFPIFYKKLLLYISLFFLPLLILYSTKKYLAIKLH